jgi:ABC-type multidrug transport system fused ATPase/permease subunit
MQNLTVIAAAHRTTTVRQSDRILVLGGGRLGHDGPPSNLAAPSRSRDSGGVRAGRVT